MFIRAPFFSFSVLTVVTLMITGSQLCADSAVVDRYTKKDTDISQKRFQQKEWSGKIDAGLMYKSFPIEEWRAPYSSLGAKKSNISVEDSKDK
jgi:hypothetical protein